MSHWLPGSAGGVVDWPAFLGSLRAVAYTGPFLYETRPPAEDPAEALRRIEGNYAHLMRLLETARGDWGSARMPLAACLSCR